MNSYAYTAEEVAKMFKISKHTVYELIKRGELNAFKVGNKMRIDKEEVDRYKRNSQAIMKKVQSETISSPSITPIRLSGSHDFIVEQLTKYVSKYANDFLIQPSYIGSLEGLMMLYRGLADIAAIHLLDPNTNEYNLPFIKQLFTLEKITVLRLATREQGFIVSEGNPKNVHSFQDLTRKDITFVNRQKGSGTRFLVDASLAQHKIDPIEIKGYGMEEWNHLATATQVSRGSVDVTFGIRSAAEQLGLHFIPVTEENFDFVFRWSSENEECLNCLYQLIRSEEFKSSLSLLSGYDITELGKVVVNTYY
ncbi:substrate-binding domain-containing protein [Alkalihalobacterium alkalinitrilicum]|uniref:substrate-binding domain-containing protein n=1 Tax=Alkalihalobacterium alkalinitrilicum TaxID=427920 RepID=UPI0009953874|nr:helix-turn-helix transcriptional regulator [Alkalihalobacterium alkalinitrilicum]